MSVEVHVEAYANSLLKKNEELCGDRVKIIHNEDSFIMVLADGLGSGVKANILSTLTSTILSELLNSGLSLNDAIETIAATLPECKERGVAYSTFTALQVFYNQTAYLVEFDNPQSIILRGGREYTIPRTAITKGNRTIYESNFIVSPDDYIVAFSDGVLHAGLGIVLNFGWDRKDVVNHVEQTFRKNDKAKDMVNNLLYMVNDLYQDKPGDDSTVAIARILKATEARVMVGPPIRQEDDEKVVYRLMEASGKKIVCGGTTAQIVARQLQADIIMEELISFESDVPPGAKINGIDLTTEGVLTLGKVGNYLRECRQSIAYYESFMETQGKDCAIKMAKTLLEDCSAIRFLVGRADNPAHSGIAYSPISLSNKIKLIEKIADDLKFFGKIVSIELY